MDFEEGDLVVVIDGQISGEGEIVGEDPNSPGSYFVRIPTVGDDPCLVHGNNLMRLTVTEEIEAPPFGLDATAYSEYMSTLVLALEDQITDRDTSEGYGYQRFEGESFDEIVTSALCEVENVILGAIELHIRLARVLGALEKEGLE